MLPLSELTLGHEPDAVPRARRFTARWLASEPEEIVEDAEQLVSELVTNAILHGAEPVTLRLLRSEGALRIEVEDASRALPVLARPNADTMTGRGLSLVAALSSGWGVKESAVGKVVWAELGEDTDESAVAPLGGLDLDLQPRTADASAAPRYVVQLGAVPTDLLLAAKAHIDNVVRELTLMKVDQAATGAQLPEPMARLVESVTSDWAEARDAIKRQALAAAARGDAETNLTLDLPLSAADSGERYLAALDAADRFARASRLLTVSAPVLHRAFRRWYVQALVDQLRAVEAGAPGRPTTPFPQALADEVDRLSNLEDTWDRLQLLQRFTRELTGAATVPEITAVIMRNALGDLGAQSVRVYLLDDDGMLRSAAVGGGIATEGDYTELRLDADLPGPLVVRTGVAMYFRNRDQLTARFPVLTGIYPEETSLHVTPLRVSEHTLGVLTMAFAAVSDVDAETQAEFVGALSDALAQAFERAIAMERGDVARRRLAFLADASVAFGLSLDFEATLDAVSRLLVPTLADWCIVQLQQDDGQLAVAALHHNDAGQVAWAKSMSGRFPLTGERPGGAPTVVATGESQFFPELDSEVLAAMAANDEHRDVIRALGMSSAMVVPLTGRSGTFGAITLLYADSGRQYAAEDVSFVEDVARRAAIALETAETFRAQSGRLADVRRVADATQRAILAPVPPRLGPISLAGRYVSATAEALIGGDLYEVVPRPGGVRLLVGDVRGKGLTAIRIATIVLGEFRAAAADIPDLGDVARQIDRRLRPYLSDEDFATAVLADVADDGSYSVVSCGHPAPLLIVGGSAGELSVVHSLPLGLGAAPTATEGWLNPGDRLVLYTDGVVEARDGDRRFVDLSWVISPLESGDLQYALDEVLERLHRFAGRELGDDVALIVAEYRP
ncbi:MAG TPA: SpoIIE family protein phosphatase [Mycobacteriales bacterium]|nr:SpoIIE family protein phosphatase [Mycobacteriales bacterium]